MRYNKKHIYLCLLKICFLPLQADSVFVFKKWGQPLIKPPEICKVYPYYLVFSPLKSFVSLLYLESWKILLNLKFSFFTFASRSSCFSLFSCSRINRDLITMFAIGTISFFDTALYTLQGDAFLMAMKMMLWCWCWTWTWVSWRLPLHCQPSFPSLQASQSTRQCQDWIEIDQIAGYESESKEITAQYPQSSKIMNLTNITLVLEKAILNKITTYLVEQVFCTHVKGALHRLHLLLNVAHLPFLENSIKNLRSNSWSVTCSSNLSASASFWALISSKWAILDSASAVSLDSFSIFFLMLSIFLKDKFI